MDKTLIIGVGGTGCDAIRSLRKKVVEIHGSLDKLPNLGFLYIDTDPKEAESTRDNLRRWEVLGQSIMLDASEQVIIKAKEIASIIDNLDDFPQFKEWFPVEELRTIDNSAKDMPGARQIRALGRFAFTLGIKDIEHAFKNKLNSLPMQEGGGETNIYLISSLSGGTGSGMLFDLAYGIQEWSGTCQLYSFLVFPHLQAVRGDRYLVNAYTQRSLSSIITMSGRLEGSHSVFLHP